MKVILSILISRMDDRGGDSYGYYQGGEIVKNIGTAAYGVDLDKITSGRSLMLHTRKATIGEKTRENAHPWRINNLVGIHNGGVQNHMDIQKKYSRNFNVDSQHIFAHISEDLPLHELTSWGALVYVDELESYERMWCSRFNDGVLTIIGVGNRPKETTDLLFCSLPDALKSAIDMAKIPYATAYKVDAGRLYHMYNGELHYTLPEITLPFNPRNIFGRRSLDFDLSYVPAKRIETSAPNNRLPKASFDRAYPNPNELNCGYDKASWEGPPRLKETRRNERKEQIKQRSKIEHKSEIEIRAFVRSRTGLEAWYKGGKCAYCEAIAQVRVPTTEQIFCTDCWEHWEEIYPILLTEHEFYLVGGPLMKVPDRTVVHPDWDDVNSGVQINEYEDLETEDEDEMENSLCERCLINKATEFHAKLDMTLCIACRIENHIPATEVVQIIDLQRVFDPQNPHQVDDNLEKDLNMIYPEDTQCDQKCGEYGLVRYMDRVNQKFLFVCLTCLDILTERDKKLDRPIQIGFHRPIPKFTLIKNPNLDIIH